MRDAVDDDVVSFRFVEANAADLDHFGLNLAPAAFVNAFDNGFGKRLLASHQYAYSFHKVSLFDLTTKMSLNWTPSKILNLNVLVKVVQDEVSRKGRMDGNKSLVSSPRTKPIYANRLYKNCRCLDRSGNSILDVVNLTGPLSRLPFFHISIQLKTAF